MSNEIKVLSVGAGFMGSLHAKAYEQIAGVRNVGIVTRNYSSSENLADVLGGDVPRFTDFEEALEKTSPNAVAGSNASKPYPRTHNWKCASTLRVKNFQFKSSWPSCAGLAGRSSGWSFSSFSPKPRTGCNSMSVPCNGT